MFFYSLNLTLQSRNWITQLTIMITVGRDFTTRKKTRRPVMYFRECHKIELWGNSKILYCIIFKIKVRQIILIWYGTTILNLLLNSRYVSNSEFIKSVIDVWLVACERVIKVSIQKQPCNIRFWPIENFKHLKYKQLILSKRKLYLWFYCNF